MAIGSPGFSKLLAAKFGISLPLSSCDMILYIASVGSACLRARSDTVECLAKTGRVEIIFELIGRKGHLVKALGEGHLRNKGKHVQRSWSRNKFGVFKKQRE